MSGTSSFEVGIRVPAAGPIPAVVQTVRRAEKQGLDMAWFSDSPLNYRDIWAVLGAVAVSTDRIRIGPAVTNLASRHLTVTASAARAISEVVKERFSIALGAGDSGVGYDSLRSATVAQMEQGINDLRALLSGDSVRYGTFDAHLREADGPAPPIYLAASGPRTLAMAGGVADGVIITMGPPEPKLAKIAEGAAQAGRPMPKVYMLGMGGVIENEEESLSRAKVFCARRIQLEGAAMFEKAGFSVDASLLTHKSGAEGDFGHAANVAEAGRALSNAISDDLARWYLRQYTLIGSETEIEEALRGMAAKGVAGVYMGYQENSVLPDPLIDVLAPIARKLR